MHVGLKSFAICLMAVFIVNECSAILTVSDVTKEQTVWSFHWENDIFSSDELYTNGMRLNIGFINKSIGSLDWIYLDNNATQKSWYWFLGHNLYTPKDITVRQPIDGDRPYSDWLYSGIALEQREYSKDKLYSLYIEASIGMIGHKAGDYVQTTYHRWINSKDPKGWDNGINQEIAGQLLFEGRRRLFQTLEINRRNYVDFLGTVSGELGTVFIRGSAGAIVRIGWYDYDLPGRPLPKYFNENDSNKCGWSLYGFARFKLQAVYRNSLLEGGVIASDSLVEVDPHPILGTGDLGIHLSLDRFYLELGMFISSSEFESKIVDKDSHRYFQIQFGITGK
jgi:lipid A 3-O-deacylase